MSNRDPFKGNTNQGNAAQTSRDDAPFGSAGEFNSTSNKAQDKFNDGMDKADHMAKDAQSRMDKGKQKAGEMTGKAQERTDQGMDKAADAMDRGADMLRDRGNRQGGTMGDVAGTAADAMESAGSYLHDANTGEMMDQVEAYIRKNPTQSLLIAAGVGFVLAKAMK